MTLSERPCDPVTLSERPCVRQPLRPYVHIAQKTVPVFVYNAESYEIHKNLLQTVKMCAILCTVDEMSDSTDGSAVNVYKP